MPSITSKTTSIPFVDLRVVHRVCFPEWLEKLHHLLERSQWILGPECQAFEQEFAAYCGAADCVGTGSGTDALTVALWLAGVHSPEQEVITTPLTAPFTALAILRAGAQVRFADVDEHTLLLSPEKVTPLVSARTAAVIPVHLYGQVCNLGSWQEFTRNTGIPVIQDACQAHGARHCQRPLTEFSPWVAYSFYPTKNLGSLGDGGALCLAFLEDAQLARLLRDGGRKSGHVSTAPGMNSRLDEIQAAYLRVAIRHLNRWNDHRRRLAEIYDEELSRIPPDQLRLVGQPAAADRDRVYHLYVVRARRREALQEFLLENGIRTAIHYPVPLHLQPAFANCGLRPGDLPVAEAATGELLSLPLGLHLHEKDVTYVARLVRKFYRV